MWLHPGPTRQCFFFTKRDQKGPFQNVVESVSVYIGLSAVVFPLFLVFFSDISAWLGEICYTQGCLPAQLERSERCIGALLFKPI